MELVNMCCINSLRSPNKNLQELIWMWCQRWIEPPLIHWMQQVSYISYNKICTLASIDAKFEWSQQIS